MKPTIGIQYHILDKVFTGRASQKNFEFQQLMREGDIALYAKQDIIEQDICYEVIIVQRHDGRTMPGGVKIEPSEFFPSDEMFGLYGWSFGSDSKYLAEKKYQELIEQQI